MKYYNINELLERKKELEQQIQELRDIDSNELQYQKEIFTDVNSGQIKTYEHREKVSLIDYTMKFNGLLEELAKIKTTIAKFNAKEISEMLYKRDLCRTKHDYLKNIKNKLSKNKQQGRKVTRQNNEGVALEFVDFELSPMFSIEEVEKQMNETAAEERKLNTEIQKLNLNAKLKI